MPKSWPIRRTSAEHVVAGGRIETVGRLVEEHQPGIVHERLGQLRALLHAGRVATHRAVALLGEADVAEYVGSTFACGHRAAARTSAPGGR